MFVKSTITVIAASIYIYFYCEVTPEACLKLSQEKYLYAKRYQKVRGVSFEDACIITRQGTIVLYEELQDEWIDVSLKYISDIELEVRNIKPECSYVLGIRYCYWPRTDKYINSLVEPIPPTCPIRIENDSLPVNFVSFGE